MVSARYLEFVVHSGLCLELFISGGLVAFVFTKELSMFVMCGGFMTLRVCVLVVSGSLVESFLEVWLLLYRLFGLIVACLCGARDR